MAVGATFTAVGVNKAARILLEALREPRTEQDLARPLVAADRSPAEAAAPVARLPADLRACRRLETRGGCGDPETAAS